MNEKLENVRIEGFIPLHGWLDLQTTIEAVGFFL